MKLIHVSKTDVGRVRPANEDSIGSIIKNIGIYSNVYIVCDGMGGHVGGARASQIAIRSIDEYFRGTPDPTPNIALKTAIEFANMQIFGDAQANPEYKGMGTTVTLMVESNGLLYIAHVGDSRIYINTDRELYRITKDHSFVQNLVDAGQLTDSEMETHKRKNELTRALGIAMDVDVEVAPQPIRAKKGDKFLLCSDGLCGLINDSMISATINTYSDLNTAVDELILLANNAGGHDNISADLIEVIESDFVKTTFVDKNNVPNSNTGTQEVKLPNGPTKPKIDKKLQILLSLVVLVVLIVLAVGGNLLINTDNEEVPADVESIVVNVDKKNDLTLDERILLLSKFENMNDTMFYSFTKKLISTEFTKAINKSGKYIQLSDSKESKEKQKFYLSDKKIILNVIDVRQLFTESGYEMQEGSFVYILIEDLELKEIISIFDKTQDETIVEEVIEQINLNKRKKINDKNCSVTFRPKKAKKRTANMQSYTVTVTVKKGTVTREFTFLETIKADPKLVKESNNIIIEAILDQIELRDISKIDKGGCTRCVITFNPVKAPDASFKDTTYEFTATVKLGTENKMKVLSETIRADQALKDIHDIDESKKNDWHEIYEWHNLESLDCLIPDSDFNIKTIASTILYKYSSNIMKLNDKYLKEVGYRNSVFKDYDIKTVDCSGQIWLFSEKKQRLLRQDKGTGNQFTEVQITILEKCLSKDYPTKLCPNKEEE